jgi:hypothetical protein
MGISLFPVIDQNIVLSSQTGQVRRAILMLLQRVYLVQCVNFGKVFLKMSKDFTTSSLLHWYTTFIIKFTAELTVMLMPNDLV